MLIDLSAAFDTINHQYLLKRLENVYHFSGTIIKWIQSYLSGRSYKVCVNGSVSEETALEIGVPQGSILGPLFFILYTKGIQALAQKYNFSIHLYADDTQLYFEFNPKNDNKDILHNLEKCFIDIKNWMSSNYLRMNDDKTVVMELNSPYTCSPPIDTFHLDDCDIIPTDSAKNLGYWFDKHLSLNTQINNVSKKCHQNLRKIGRIGSKLTKDLKIQLVHASIHSIIDFCNGTYFVLTKIQLGKLQKIQNAAVRLIYNLKGKERFQSITPLLKELHFLPVIYRIKYKIALITYKCINNIAPPYLSCLLKV